MNLLTKDVLLNSYKTTIVQFVGVAARLMTSVFLGRILGAAGLGDVNLINQIITILMVFSMFGMDHVLVKKIAIYRAENLKNAIGKVIYTGLISTTLIALFLTVLVLIAADPIAHFFDAYQLKIPLMIAASVLVPQTIGVVFAVAANSFEKVWQSRLLKEGLTSIFVLLGLGIAYVFQYPLDLLNVILIYALSRVLTFLLSFGYLKRLYTPIAIKSALDASMIQMAKPLLFVSATTLLASSVDVIMLGWLSASEDVGLYTVAARLVIFMALFLQITNAALSPKIAAFFAQQKMVEIKTLVQQVTFGLFIIAVLGSMSFFFFGELLLGFWGDEFIAAYTCLLILCVGQFVNLTTGCSGILLIMSGHEKVFSYVSAGALGANLLLNYIFIQWYGIVGAAIATSTTISVENIIRLIIAKRKTGLWSLPKIRIRKG